MKMLGRFHFQPKWKRNGNISAPIYCSCCIHPNPSPRAKKRQEKRMWNREYEDA